MARKRKVGIKNSWALPLRADIKGAGAYNMIAGLHLAETELTAHWIGAEESLRETELPPARLSAARPGRRATNQVSRAPCRD